MGYIVVKQQNGMFGIFCKYNAKYDIVNADPNSLSQVMVEDYGYDSLEEASRVIHDIDNGKLAYGTETLTWDDTKRVILEVYNQDHWDCLVEDIQMDIDRKIKVGNYVFIVGDDEGPGRPIGAAFPIESVDDNKVTLKSDLEPFERTVTEMLDTSRFLICVDQHIKGFDYTTKAPTEPGHFWFYGYPDCKGSMFNEIRLEMVEVLEANKGKFRAFFDDDIRWVENIEKNGVGLWAKADYPSMPGLV